jgi:hypothetical protein
LGLTVYYDWKLKSDVAAARRVIGQFHALAQALPFDEVSEIYEQNSPDSDSAYCLYDQPFDHGGLYLARKREDGEEELVHVPALHALFFSVRVEGAETASIGMASHPPVVLHREDIIERNDAGTERRQVGQGDPVEFPTQRRGYYSWQSSCKTQYAANPKFGGEANFLRAHLSLIELLDQFSASGARVCVRDDSNYAQHRNVDRLLESLRDWDSIVARFAGRLSDAFGDSGGMVVAPIKQRPDFEHLEAKGIEVLKKLSAEQQRRKKGS